jgi:bifunctional UDP-N-acetylglucosamine pyrophosphorylase/glucosamine-1-phosphate N-acetyltransferase
MNLAVVILAAGQGKRMKSDLPKVLQPLAGVRCSGMLLCTLNPSSMRGLATVATRRRSRRSE